MSLSIITEGATEGPASLLVIDGRGSVGVAISTGSTGRLVGEPTLPHCSPCAFLYSSQRNCDSKQ